MTNNIDPAEIAKFSSLADDWWNPNGQCKPLHDINPLRLQFITDHVDLKGKNVIDIGCGGGILTESLYEQGAKVTGLDASIDLINIAKAHAQTHQRVIDYHAADINRFAEKHPNAFDALTCMELLEHVEDPQAIIQACARLVKPGGWVFFSTINRNPKAYAMAIVAAEYLLKLLEKGTHDYQRFIKPSELAQMAHDVGLSVTDIAGMHYNPITRQYKLSQDVSVNYLMVAKRCKKPK